MTVVFLLSALFHTCVCLEHSKYTCKRSRCESNISALNACSANRKQLNCSSLDSLRWFIVNLYSEFLCNTALHFCSPVKWYTLRNRQFVASGVVTLRNQLLKRIKCLIKPCVMMPWVENTPLNGVHVYKVVKFWFRGLKVLFANRQSDSRKCAKCAPSTQGGQAAAYDRPTVR
jgi:hypothetical protein